MDTKDDRYYRSLGFNYSNEKEFNHEFALAKAFFELFPNETKIRRKLGGAADWPRVLKVLHNQRPELVPDLKKALAHPPKHSYLNQTSAADPNVKLVVALGRPIASGHFGIVKNAIDEHGKHLAQKIEKSNTQLQRRETEINRRLGLLFGEKFTRKGGKLSDQDKFYTSFPNLGLDLFDRFALRHLSHSKNINIARKTAWELHKLHSGDNPSHTAYAHCDLKPENIMLKDNGHVTIVDYGMSKQLNEPIVLQGTTNYLPTDYPERFNEPSVQRQTLLNMQELGLIGTDIAAYKKTFNAIFIETGTFEFLSDNIKQMLYCSETELLYRKNLDTTLKFVMVFIEQEMRLRPDTLCNLPQTNQQIIAAIFEDFDKLEELSAASEHHDFMLIAISTMKNAVIHDAADLRFLEHYKQNINDMASNYHQPYQTKTTRADSDMSTSSYDTRKFTLFGKSSSTSEDSNRNKFNTNKESTSIATKDDTTSSEDNANNVYETIRGKNFGVGK